MNYRFFCGFQVKAAQKKWWGEEVKNFAIRGVFKNSFLFSLNQYTFHSGHHSECSKDDKADFTVWVVVSAIFIDTFTNKHFTCKEIRNVTEYRITTDLN